jgi:hypothetical protein
MIQYKIEDTVVFMKDNSIHEGIVEEIIDVTTKKDNKEVKTTFLKLDSWYCENHTITIDIALVYKNKDTLIEYLIKNIKSPYPF